MPNNPVACVGEICKHTSMCSYVCSFKNVWLENQQQQEHKLLWLYLLTPSDSYCLV